MNQSEKIIKYLERNGFKLKSVDIDSELYLFQKGKTIIGIKD